jgi:hypothetical protein
VDHPYFDDDEAAAVAGEQTDAADALVMGRGPTRASRPPARPTTTT